MYYPNSNDWWLDPSHGSFDIRVNGLPAAVTLNASGNLGIGTTSPMGLFHVYGSANGQIIANSVGKLQVIRTAPTFALTLSAENRQAPAGDTGPVFGFYGNTDGNSELGSIYAGWNGAANSNAYMAFHTNNGGASAEAMRITSSGGVGIGTTAPSARLNVVENLIDGYAAWFQNLAGIRGHGILVTAGDDTVSAVNITNSLGANRISFFGSGNGYFAGNVGIGTTSPGYKLDVQGGQVNASGGLCIAADCRASWSAVAGSAAQLASTQTFTGQNTFAAQVAVSSSFFVTGGNVGIGTTGPAVPLHIRNGSSGGSLSPGGLSNSSLLIERAGTTELDFLTPSASQAGIRWWDATGTQRAGIGYFNSAATPADYMYFMTAGIQRMALDGNGNVGIGTPNPNASLDAEGANGIILNSISVSVGNATNIAIGAGSSSDLNASAGSIKLTAGMTTRRETNNGAALSLGGGSDAGGSGGGLGGSAALSGGSSRFGNVGPGSLSLLGGVDSVKGGDVTILSGGSLIDNTPGGDINLGAGGSGKHATGGKVNISAGASGAGGLGGSVSVTAGVGDGTFGTSSGGNVSISGGGAVSGSGNVTGGMVSLMGGNGSGTTGGNVALQGGSGAAYGNVVLQASGGSVGIGTTSPTGLFQVGGGTLTVTSAGNVGIGTTSPASTLDVEGNIANYAATISQNGGLTSAYGGLLVNTNSTGVNSLAVTNSGSTLLVVKGNGLVGIGTTAPVTPLDVAGNGQMWIRAGAGGGLPPSAGAGLKLEYNPNGGSIQGYDYLNGVAKNLLLNQGGGNVGIGTTNPTAKLHVGGTNGVDGIRFPDGSLQTTAFVGNSTTLVASMTVTNLATIPFSGLSPSLTYRVEWNTYISGGNSAAVWYLRFNSDATANYLPAVLFANGVNFIGALGGAGQGVGTTGCPFQNSSGSMNTAGPDEMWGSATFRIGTAAGHVQASYESNFTYSSLGAQVVERGVCFYKGPSLTPITSVSIVAPQGVTGTAYLYQEAR